MAAMKTMKMTRKSRCPHAAPASWHQWCWPSSWVSDKGDVVPWGLVALCGTRTVSLAGWWLVAASRAQQVPRPSLSLHPSQGVSLGGTVTLRCHLPRLAARVWLYQEGGWTYRYHKEKENNTAEFSFIKTTWEHAGMYRCQYQVLVLFGTSETSDPVQLVLTDHRYPSPRISLSPDDLVGTGTNLQSTWRWGPMSPFSVGTRAIGEPSFYTSMGTQPLSSVRTTVVWARPPSASLR
ncbi:uncharacterized protein LOC121107823 [Gallus gallus]|uniref:uncharacterized protein LOC121107823 n=1 Tax=Gallus gallus TaxID=9031 RepID=UPI001AEB6FA6|nr:uncharacterized protein LOC121107823 [Gallus gallus]